MKNNKKLKGLYLISTALFLLIGFTSCNYNLLHATFDHPNHIVGNPPSAILPEGPPTGDEIIIHDSERSRYKIETGIIQGKSLTVLASPEVTHSNWLSFKGVNIKKTKKMSYSWQGTFRDIYPSTDNKVLIDLMGETMSVSFSRIYIYPDGQVFLSVTDLRGPDIALGKINPKLIHKVTIKLNIESRIYDITISDGKSTLRRNNVNFISFGGARNTFSGRPTNNFAVQGINYNYTIDNV